MRVPMAEAIAEGLTNGQADRTQGRGDRLLDGVGVGLATESGGGWVLVSVEEDEPPPQPPVTDATPSSTRTGTSKARIKGSSSRFRANA
ncbi:hypothetical protein [Actinoallomurus oryzae]|uniref:hypothetical protein n=1 Tax=Actinoallomurus oryzae TaxID=502180 RepID=UPI0031F090DF